MLVCAFFRASFHTRIAGAAKHPAFPAPLIFEGLGFIQTSGAICAAEKREVVFSGATSLRAQRSNPSFRTRGANRLLRFTRNDGGKTVARVKAKAQPGAGVGWVPGFRFAHPGYEATPSNPTTPASTRHRNSGEIRRRRKARVPSPSIFSRRVGIHHYAHARRVRPAPGGCRFAVGEIPQRQAILSRARART